MSTEQTTDYWNTSKAMAAEYYYNYYSAPHITITATYITIGCIGLAGNAFVILVIFTHTAMRKQMTNLLIINQSLIDAVASVALVFSAIFPYTGQSMTGVPGVLLCRLWYSTFLLWATMNASTYNLLAIALERYCCIVYPIMYKNNVTVRSVMLVCGSVWATGALVVFFYTILPARIDENLYCIHYWSSESIQAGFGFFSFVFNFAIPLFVMFICYVKIIMALKSRSIKVSAAESSSQSSSQEKDDAMARATSNVFKTLVTVSVCFVICWTPGRCLYFIYNLGGYIDFLAWYYHSTVIMGYINCCCNPFVYVAQYEQFQKGVRKLKSTISSHFSDASNSSYLN